MHVEFFLLILSLLFFVSIFADKIGYKYGVPALLLFLVVGMFFGSHSMTGLIGMSGVQIDIDTAQGLSTVAMCIILFTGGLETKLSDIKSVLAPGITLATLGVLITCVITGAIIHLLFGRLCLDMARTPHGGYHVLHRQRQRLLCPPYQRYRTQA